METRTALETTSCKITPCTILRQPRRDTHYNWRQCHGRPCRRCVPGRQPEPEHSPFLFSPLPAARKTTKQELSLEEKREHSAPPAISHYCPGSQPRTPHPQLHGRLLGGVNSELVGTVHTQASLPLWTYQLSITSRCKGPHLLAASWPHTCALG